MSTRSVTITRNITTMMVKMIVVTRTSVLAGAVLALLLELLDVGRCLLISPVVAAVLVSVACTCDGRIGDEALSSL